MQKSGYQPIEDYGIIGDLCTVALVGIDGSIDFMCFPEFDSPTLFAAILDKKKGGYFRIQATHESAHAKQIYLPQSKVLLTRFLSEEGVAEISDFMPVQPVCPTHELIRRVKSVRGTNHFKLEFFPRFNYGRSEHRIEREGNNYIFESEGEDKTVIRFRCPVEAHITEEGGIVSEFTLEHGQSLPFIMEEVTGSNEDSPASNPDFVSEAFKETMNFWRSWISRMKYNGRWREMMERSALTLKLLTARKYGSLVAAPTFGLPEEIGGIRNWDYRYTWIRDASFTLYALIRLGYTEESEAFMRWIEDRCTELNEDGSLNIMYGINGRHELKESVLSHFEGYRGSSPVRIGNGAYDQLQLDIYGELMDSIYLYDKFTEQISYDLWQNVVKLTNWVIENWNQPDEGIWEVRGGQKKFLFSRVMCWVAVDRAVRMALKRSLPAPLDVWIDMRNKIHNSIYNDFWDPGIASFVQFKDSGTLDASTLLLPLVRFISPKDPRWLSTLKGIEHQLVEDSLVYRYKNLDNHDGLVGDEGTFSMCTFWYVECLSRSGDLDKARFFMEKMLGYANHLGLYAEELGPRGEHLGNFPQAFTHLGFISAAFDLDRRLNERGY